MITFSKETCCALKHFTFSLFCQGAASLHYINEYAVVFWMKFIVRLFSEVKKFQKLMNNYTVTATYVKQKHLGVKNDEAKKNQQLKALI